MTLQELQTILHFNMEPVERPTDEQLARAEEELGLKLPDDYKEFIKYYGRGNVARFIHLHGPSSQFMSADLVAMAKIDREGYKSGRYISPDDFPYARYPETDGLLPWAYTINNDMLYWLTKGECNSWSVVVYERSSSVFQIFNVGMVAFIGQLILGKIKESPFPDNVPFREGKYFIEKL